MEEYSVEYYQQINKIEYQQAAVLANKIIELYHPKTVGDLGCGTGLYLAPFIGTVNIAGLDFSESAFDPAVIQVPRELVGVRDLRTDLYPESKRDVALCLEVVEHIGSEYAEILVDNICKASDILVVTSAPPGQAGLNHVNCQPQEYWQAKFEARGFKRDYHDEYQLVEAVSKVPHTVWIIRNLMVYKKI